MKKYLIAFLSITLLIGCSDNESDNKDNTVQINENLNIILTPDLSNRIESELYPKPVNDTVLINTIYRNYYPTIYKINNRVIGQKDKISVTLTNPAIINRFGLNLNNLTMDLTDMKPAERIDYLTKDKNDDDLKLISSELHKIYSNAERATTGGDIYNYFKEQISSINTAKDSEPITIDKTTVINHYRNIIILFTDGYIEAGLYGANNCVNNKCYFLDKKTINKFRSEFNHSGESDMKVFFKKSGYGIIPIENEYLKNTEVIVAEMYDRSLNKITGSQTVSPNDFEIMKLFWSDWLESSGVKHYRLMSVSNTKEEFLENIKQFIEEK